MEVKHGSKRNEAGEKSGSDHWSFVCFASVDLILCVHTFQSMICVLLVEHGLILGVFWYLAYLGENLDWWFTDLYP